MAIENFIAVNDDAYWLYFDNMKVQITLGYNEWTSPADSNANWLEKNCTENPYEGLLNYK